MFHLFLQQRSKFFPTCDIIKLYGKIFCHKVRLCETKYCKRVVEEIFPKEAMHFPAMIRGTISWGNSTANQYIPRNGFN